jgi:hypothetical protein
MPDARPLTMRRSVPPCSATYIVPLRPFVAPRNAIATGLDSPVAAGISRSCTAARSAAALRGRVLDVTAGFTVVVVVVVGAADVGAVDGAAWGELLLHPANASVSVPAMAPARSFRIEPRLGLDDAYASSP